MVLNAVKTAYENASHDLAALRYAWRAGDDARQKRICCNISSYRKGILDLGFLDHEFHERIIDNIDILSTTSLEIWLGKQGL